MKRSSKLQEFYKTPSKIKIILSYKLLLSADPMKSNLNQILIAMIVTALFNTNCIAKDFPQRPINLVVPFAPGGGTDSIARDLAKNLTEQLGQAVIVDNRAGGGGAIGAQMVAKSEPDGYTLLFVTSTFITHAATENTLTYDVIKDFAPIAMIGRGPLMVVANAELGLNSIQDLIRYTKSSPSGVNFCSAGQGSINHLAGELFKMQTKTFITHIPYRGAGPALADLMAGQVDMMFDGLGSSAQNIKSGKIKALAVASEKRVAAFPNLPTASEAGVPGYVVSTWYGLWAPKDTPKEIVDKMTVEVTKALNSPELKDIWLNNGSETPHLIGDNFAKFVSDDIKRWAAVVKASGAKLD